MKNIKILISSLFLVLCLAGCKKDEPVLPIELTPPAIMFRDESTREIQIVSGNGGYSIVYPKKIDIDTPVFDESGNYLSYWETNSVDYTDDYFKIKIDDDNSIEVSYIGPLNSYEIPIDQKTVEANFLVQDRKGEKQIFGLIYPFILGGEWHINEELLNDPDYWQE